MYPLKIKEKYDVNNLENLWHRFSVVYLGTYLEGDFKEFAWSHPGIDIRPETPNQQIFAVLDGTVFKSWEDAAYGKYIFLEHVGVPHPDDFSRTTTLYSCYQHLSEVGVKTGDTVVEWQNIGKTGNTGISFGEHLHFQMDRQEAPFHAYWPYTWAEVKAAGVGFSQGVNIGLWQDKAKMYTLNPLVYLDAVADMKNTTKPQTVSKPEKVEEDILLEKIEEKIEEKVISEIPVSPPEVVVEPLKEIPLLKKEEIIVKNDKDILLASLDIDDLWTRTDTKWFTDIEKTHPYFSFIEKLGEEGIISWFHDHTFRPLNAISRTEVLKMIILAKKLPISTDKKSYFQDVGTDYWQNKYINTALENGIVSSDNKQFFPNEFISRVEALKMMIQLFVWEIENTYEGQFRDVQKTDWFAKYVGYAVQHDLLSYTSSFFPNQKITRIEIIEMLHHFMK